MIYQNTLMLKFKQKDKFDSCIREFLQTYGKNTVTLKSAVISS